MQPKHASKPSRTAPLLVFVLLVLLAGLALVVLKPGDLDDSKSAVSQPVPAKTTTTKPSSTSTTAARSSTTTTVRGSQATTSTTTASGGSTTTTRSSTATTSTSAPSSTSPPTTAPPSTARPTTTTRSGTGSTDRMANTGGQSLILPGMAALALALVVRRLALR